MKKDSKKKAPRSAQLSREIVRDWAPLFKRLTDVIDWALDIASQLSRNYHEDHESIENVRVFVHAWLEGQRAELPLNDLLTTIAILFAAIEIDLGIDSVSLLAPLRTMLEAPSTLPKVIRCPGVERAEKPTVVIRRFPGRNASAAFHHFAA